MNREITSRKGYVISKIGFEYNDEGYNLTEGVHPESVYFDKDVALNAVRQRTREFCANNHSAGQYCFSLDECKGMALHERFPEVFNEYGEIQYTGTSYKDRKYATITAEVCDYIADNFQLFTISEIEVYN